MLTSTYSLVQHTLTNVGFVDIPTFNGSSSELLQYLVSSLSKGVFNGKGTDEFRQKLKVIGVVEITLPSIVAVVSGSTISVPTASPSTTTRQGNVENKSSKSTVNQALLSGLLGGLFAFVCVCVPVLYLTRRRLQKKKNVDGGEDFLYDIFSISDNISGQNKMSALQQLKTGNERKQERNETLMKPIASTAISISNASETIEPQLFDEYHSRYDIERNRIFRSRSSRRNGGEESFDDWVNSLHVTSPSQSMSSASTEVSEAFPQKNTSDIMSYNDIYSSKDVDHIPVFGTEGQFSVQSVLKQGNRQNPEKIGNLEQIEPIHEIQRTSSWRLNFFDFYSNEPNKLATLEQQNSLNLADIYPDEDKIYHQSAVESVSIVRTYSNAAENDPLYKLKFPDIRTTPESIGTDLVEVDITTIYPDVGMLPLPDLQQEIVNNKLNASPVASRPSNIISTVFSPRLGGVVSPLQGRKLQRTPQSNNGSKDNIHLNLGIAAVNDVLMETDFKFDIPTYEIHDTENGDTNSNSEQSFHDNATSNQCNIFSTTENDNDNIDIVDRLAADNIQFSMDDDFNVLKTPSRIQASSRIRYTSSSFEVGGGNMVESSGDDLSHNDEGSDSDFDERNYLHKFESYNGTQYDVSNPNIKNNSKGKSKPNSFLSAFDSFSASNDYYYDDGNHYDAVEASVSTNRKMDPTNNNSSHQKTNYSSSFFSPQVSNFMSRQTFTPDDHHQNHHQSQIHNSFVVDDALQPNSMSVLQEVPHHCASPHQPPEHREQRHHYKLQQRYYQEERTDAKIKNNIIHTDRLKHVIPPTAASLSSVTPQPPPISSNGTETIETTTPVHSVKFRAIKMKFETMIQRNIKTSTSFTLSPTASQSHYDRGSHKRCRSEDGTAIMMSLSMSSDAAYMGGC